MTIYYYQFKWDPNKNATNIEKCEITFEEASTIFDDVFARVISDPDRSDNEGRFIILGVSIKANVLIVCHCLRQSGRSIRIKSARKATKKEVSTYWRYRHES